MSLPNEINLLQFGEAVGVSDTSVRSLRFRAANSPNLKRTPLSAGNQRTWTWSGWVKRSATGTNHVLFGARTGASATYTIFYFDASDKLAIIGDTFAAGCLTTAVFRDTTAWYHIVWAIDTTQATATLTGSSTDRIRLWVNGVQITSFSTVTLPAQNASLNINSTADHYFSFNNTTNFLDGYIAEVNFVDGQSLTPSSFAQTNPTTGVWEPKPYTGTYGINGFYLPFSDFTNSSSNLLTFSEDFTNAAWSIFNTNSVVVTGNSTTAPNGASTADLIVNNNQATSLIFQTLATATIGTGNQVCSVYAKQYLGNTTGFTFNCYYVGDTEVNINFYLDTGTSDAGGNIVSVGNGWYRCSIRVPARTGAGTSFVWRIWPGGRGLQNTSGYYFWGAQISNGTTPPYYLATTSTIQSSVNNLGTDRSNGTSSWNSYVPTNLSITTGPTYDSTTDHPLIFGGDNGLGGEIRGNFCTLNVLSGLGNGTYSDAACGFVSGVLSTWRTAIGTMAVRRNFTTGKFYFESTIQAISSGNFFMPGVCGIQTNNTLPTTYVGQLSNGWGFQWPVSGTGGAKWNNNVSTGVTTVTPVVNNVLQVAFDVDNGLIWFGINNIWVEGDPASGTGASFTGLPSVLFPAVGVYSNAGDKLSVNFGQRPFTYAAPTGFRALSTANFTIVPIGS